MCFFYKMHPPREVVVSELRAALIGVGFVGRAHVDALRRLGVPILGILGSSSDRTNESCRALGLPRAYASLADLCADPDVDVVHICTPNHLHCEQARTLLQAGKHVMCEKPLAMNASESAELLRIATDQGRVGGVCYNLRYYPLCQEARALIEQGAIGEPRLVHGSFLQDWLFFPSDWNWRLEPWLGGDSRAVSDIGTHWLDLTTWLTGRKVLELCADLATVIPIRKRPARRVETFQAADDAGAANVKISTDDYASILLHYQGGICGVMTVSQVSAGHKAKLSFEINGSEASLGWNSEEPNQLWIGRRNDANLLLPKDPSLMTPASRGYAAYPGGHTEGYPDTFVQLFKDFYAYIRKGDLNVLPTFPTFETGHEELVLCEAVVRSAAQRQWVRV